MNLACHTRIWGEAFDAAWAEAREAGFAAVETFCLSQWFDRPDDFRARLADAGLTLAAMEFGGEWVTERAAVERDGAERLARFLSAVGGGVMVVSGGRRSPEGAPPETFSRLAEAMNGLGDFCRDRGLRLCYHPRRGSLIEYRDQVVLFLNATDPERVSLCLDTGDLASMGCDPLEAMQTHRDRVGHVHLKDLDWHTHEPLIPGEGALNLAHWLKELNDGGYAGWVTAEMDSSPRPLEDARASYRFLQNSLNAVK